MPALTALQVKNAKPGRHADGRGLYLLVRASGSRSWVLRTQADGKRHDLGLGSTTKLTLSQARAKAAPDWNAYSLIATIEEAHLTEGNPPIPDVLERDYRTAWASLLPLALRDLGKVQDDLTVRGILAVIAHAKGQQTLAAIALCTEDERLEMLNA